MKTQITLEHFQTKTLPLLRIGCNTPEELQTKASDYVKDIELMDGDQPVQLTDVDLGEIETKSFDQQDQGGITKAELGEIVTKAVADELKKQPQPKRLRITQIEPEPKAIVYKRFGALKNFKGKSEDGKSADERAYRFGSFCMAAIHKCVPNRFHSRAFLKAVQFCTEQGLMTEWTADVETKAQNEGTNTQGGYLVPEEFSNDMIDLRLQYGVFRRNANVIPMASDTFSRPRRTGGLTTYFVGEAAPGTQSTATWDRVSLTAKKLMVLTKMSSEVNEDATINLGDTLAGEIAYAFANKEDECGFNGDGGGVTYGGIRGIRERLKTLNGTAPTTGSGLFLGAGNLYSELTLADFNTVVSCLPTFARRAPKWYASPRFYDSVMAKLQYAAGGVTKLEISEGVNQMFLGYPVELTEVMPTAEANSQVCALFGDIGLAADFGDRRSNTIAFSDSALNAFEQDELVIRGTQRFDINVHDIGTTAVGGPIVGLITAAS